MPRSPARSTFAHPSPASCAPQRSLYKTAEGRERILALYDTAVERLDGITHGRIVRRWIDTSFGATHVLDLGPADGPPVVVFQGGNFLNPLTLAWLAPLTERYRLLAPDTVGHPGLSDERRLSPRDASYGRWGEEVLNGLELDRAPVVGISYGAGVALRLAGVAPERIAAAALLVPAGFVAPPIVPLLGRIVAPMLAYLARPSDARLVRAVRPMFGDRPDPDWTEAIGAVFDHVRLASGMPAPATSAELHGFTAPTLVLAAERDPFFPGETVARKARNVMPHARVSVMAGEAHVPRPEALRAANACIARLLDPVTERAGRLA